MLTTRGNGRAIRLATGIPLLIVALAALVLGLKQPPSNVSANAGDTFGPACGTAVMDGIVNPGEWSSAATQTFQMYSPGSATPFTATLYVMNSGHNLYIAITINDDEFSTVGQWLPQGDGFRIDFDNDHSGTLFALGDDVLTISAGMPQFGDNFIIAGTSSPADAEHGGTSDGSGATSRVGNLNHFELRHPLCSGDALDFCLHAGSVVGFRLEYLDAEANGSFGSSQFFPGASNTSEAAIVIGTCPVSEFNIFVFLPFIQK